MNRFSDRGSIPLGSTKIKKSCRARLFYFDMKGIEGHGKTVRGTVLAKQKPKGFAKRSCHRGVSEKARAERSAAVSLESERRFPSAPPEKGLSKESPFSTKSTRSGGRNIATQCEILASLE